MEISGAIGPAVLTPRQAIAGALSGRILRHVFEAVVQACMNAGLVKGEGFAAGVAYKF